MSGFLTNQRLWGATTFVNHVSYYVYVHLMRDLSLPKTFLAKLAMEKVMAQAGRTVKHYHSDNGWFAVFSRNVLRRDKSIMRCTYT